MYCIVCGQCIVYTRWRVTIPYRESSGPKRLRIARPPFARGAVPVLTKNRTMYPVRLCGTRRRISSPAYETMPGSLTHRRNGRNLCHYAIVLAIYRYIRMTIFRIYHHLLLYPLTNIHNYLVFMV